MMSIVSDLVYMLAASLFIFGIKDMNRIRSARRGNLLASMAMFVAVVVTLAHHEVLNYKMISVGIIIGAIIGTLAARLVRMTAMPQMVALFNGFGGLASALVACSEYLRLGANVPSFTALAIALGSFVGAVTFAGSMVAYLKLQDLIEQQPVTYPLQKTLNFILALTCVVLSVFVVVDPASTWPYWTLLGLALLLGILLVLPIGGADMPVVISLLNSYSGIAAAMTGFVLMNKVLIVAGSLVGSAGLILTQIMCKAMNRSLANVAFATFGKIDQDARQDKGARDYTGVKSCSPEEAVMVIENAQSVIIVPGYGLAVARAQHAIRELANLLERRGIRVKYAIHPVAGRMPGHMNVLLAEAEVPYEQLFEMDTINSEFEQTDVAIVVGANDVTNPSARDQKGSPIYGMPILNVDKSKSVFVIKRSLSPGFAGIKNPLFEDHRTSMVFGDAKIVIDALIKELKSL